MLTSPHTAVGAAIGAAIPNPLIAVPLAIASHYLLDTVPHWQETLAPYMPNRNTYIRIPIDIAIAVCIVLFMVSWSPDRIGSIWAGAVAANVPDLDSFLVLKPDLLKKNGIKQYWDWHCGIQNETSQWHGVWTQPLVIALALVASYFLR